METKVDRLALAFALAFAPPQEFRRLFTCGPDDHLVQTEAESAPRPLDDVLDQTAAAGEVPLS